jgi:cytosine/uracil/thiamine/allantoin permease
MNIDYNYININNGYKFLIFFTLLFLVTWKTIYNIDKFKKINSILIICAFAVISFYILDKYYPSCNL